VHEVTIAEVKRIYWTPNFCHCAVVTKSSIVILNKTL
jgi:hypothetical protein